MECADDLDKGPWILAEAITVDQPWGARVGGNGIFRNPEDHGLFVNHLELLTTLGAMETWGPGLRRQRILMNGDNEVAVGVHNKGATKEAALDAMARAMAHTMLRHGFEARSKHVPSEEMLADPLSRGDEAAFLRRYADSGLAARYGPAKRVPPPTDFMLQCPSPSHH